MMNVLLVSRVLVGDVWWWLCGRGGGSWARGPWSGGGGGVAG